MFFRLFGNYLHEIGALSDGQLSGILEYRSKNRVKLGVLALEHGYMTEAQASEVNQLQAKLDKRFGDIAIEKAYLTEAQLGELLKQQGCPYVLFLQAVTEAGIMTREAFMEKLSQFKADKALSDAELEVIKNGTVDAIAEVMIHTGNDMADALLGLFARNLVRFISTDVAFLRPVTLSGFEASNLAYQKMNGAYSVFTGLASDGDELLTIARPYCKEDFKALDADAFDSVCEFINCTNGLFARAAEKAGTGLELAPPCFKAGDVRLSSPLYALPIKIDDRAVTAVIALADLSL